jgi:DNA polymerase (family 10)
MPRAGSNPISGATLVKQTCKTRTNAEIASALRELALRLEMEGVPYRPRAYEKAALAVADARVPLSQMLSREGEAGLDALPAVGKGIAHRIAEYLETGRIADLEELRKKTPIDVVELTGVEGVGPRTAKALWEGLGVRNLAELEAACRAKRVRSLPHFGERSEAKILASIGLRRSSTGRRLLADVLPLAAQIVPQLRAVPGVGRVAVAGSVRRRKETIGDLDFLATARNGRAVSAAFTGLPEVAQVIAQGEGKTLVRLANGMDADLRVVPPESFGAALLYFTGSKAHNVKLRRLAQERGLKLNEYGLFDGERRLASEREEDVYAALGLAPIPPELREDAGEVEAAARSELPRLLEATQLRGDLQVHTSWTDGSASIEEMADAAAALGLEYIAITDHARDLAFTGGLDEARLLEQAAAIRKIGERRGVRILAGAEVNIREDGSLDIRDDVLAQLDVVGVAVHSHFRQAREVMTKRLLRAIENPHVDLLFHPSARLIGAREPIDFDLAAVIRAAARTGTVLELDALPDRLDLRDEAAREAIRGGVRLAIDSDAHAPDQLRFARELGVGVARRAWATRSDVVNAWPLERCLAQLKDRGNRPARSRAAAGSRRKARAG